MSERYNFKSKNLFVCLQAKMEATTHTPHVAIVILNWNGRRFLENFLPSVLATPYNNFSVIVADNGSTDDSVDFLTTNFFGVRIIRFSENYGFAEGYNRALGEIDSDYYVLLNSDVEVTSDWISPVIRLMESDKKIAACQPKVLSQKNKSQFEYAGACGGWIDKLGYPFCRGRIFDYCEEDHGQYDSISEVFWATGACLFVRSEQFRRVGGFDPFFFAHQEEIDLCWRLQNAGYKIFVQPESTVYHVGGGSLEMGNPKKVFLNYRNNLIMLYKNLDSRSRFSTILIRMVLDGVAGIQLLLKGRGGSFTAVIKAHGGFYKWLFSANRKTSDHNKRKRGLIGMYAGSIVWDYFVRKKKTFSNIVDNKR